MFNKCAVVTCVLHCCLVLSQSWRHTSHHWLVCSTRDYMPNLLYTSEFQGVSYCVSFRVWYFITYLSWFHQYLIELSPLNCFFWTKETIVLLAAYSLVFHKNNDTMVTGWNPVIWRRAKSLSVGLSGYDASSTFKSTINSTSNWSTIVGYKHTTIRLICWITKKQFFTVTYGKIRLPSVIWP